MFVQITMAGTAYKSQRLKMVVVKSVEDDVSKSVVGICRRRIENRV